MAMALLVFVAPAVAADSQPGGHVAEVEAFAGIMVDVRTAAERCPDLSVDWTAVTAEKERQTLLWVRTKVSRAHQQRLHSCH